MRVIWDSKRNWTIFFLLMVIALMLYAQRASAPDDSFDEPQIAEIDLADIIARDTLRVITGNNSLSYFVYKGQPMGYEYELLAHFAQHLGVHLEILVPGDLEVYFDMLNRGKADIVADNLTITRDRQREVDFTHHHTTVRQVLIQRRPEDWWKYTKDQLDAQLIRNPIDLIGKQVHVHRNSSFDHRLQNLSDEIGGDIDIQYHDGRSSTEELIQMVAGGKIDYTVADNHIALINSTYYKNLDVRTDISYPQRIGWAVRHTSPELRKELDAWMEDMKRTGHYQVLYSKYFKNTKAYSRRLSSGYLSANGGAISSYDDIIRQYADELGWDWRLLAAQIYVESNFDSNSESWAGARGLMQLVPETAERFGDSTRMHEPEYNIRTGVRYLKWLSEFWKDIPDDQQRIKFMLASYNVGEGHVLDARRLALKFGKDAAIWDNNVDSFLVKKSYPAYYRDEVVYNGYCRGSEPYKYVRDVMSIYQHYLTLVDIGPATDKPA